MHNVIPFEKFEQDVIKKILEQNNPANAILKEQYQRARISREYTGVGFFSTFSIPENLPHTEIKDFQINNLLCDLNGIHQFGGFVLYVKNGSLSCLEGYGFDQEWPQEIWHYRLYS